MEKVMRTELAFHRACLAVAAMAVLGLAACGDTDPGPPDNGFIPIPDAGVDSGVDPGGDDQGGPSMECNEGATLGNFCRFDADCNDFCFCNGTEVCNGGICASAALPQCDDGISCTVDTCDEDDQRCSNLADDSICDDGNSCTGLEACDRDIGCLPGIPTNCSDGDSCTLDSCDPVLGCQNVLRDLDGDGYASISCEGGLDCDDDPLTGADINPDAEEICNDGIDNNCDGVADIFDTVNCRPTNELCEDATFLPNPGIYNFATFGLEDDYSLGCESGTTNPDAVFRFTITSERDVTVVIAGPVNTAVELRPTGGCEDDGSGLVCDRITSSFGFEAEGARVERTRQNGGSLEAGTYDIIVATPAEDFYSLELTIVPPTPPPRTDVCDDATPVISASTSISADFEDHSNQYGRPPCGDVTTEAVEAVYKLSLTRATNVELWSDGLDDRSFQRDMRYAIMRDCERPRETTVGCEKGDFAPVPRVTLTPLPAGDYWIMVESDDGGFATSYTLDVVLVVPPPRPPGDLCTTALDITSGVQNLDVSRLRNDGGVDCGGSTARYVDGFYEFEVTAESDVTVETNGPFHLLDLSEGACSRLNSLACQASSAGGVGTITQRLMPGTYTVGAAIPSRSGMLSGEVTITPL